MATYWFKVERVRPAVSLSARWVPLLVGGVLLVAAGLKTHRLFSDPSSSSGIFSSHWFQLMLVEAEVACGLALCLGLYPRLTRWAALLLFVCFLGAALSQAAAGATSCACFGNVPLHPWLAVAMDVGLLAALACWSPSEKVIASAWHAAVLCLGALLVFPVALLAFERSIVYPRLEVSPATVDMGSLTQGERRVFVLRLRNVHQKPVTIHDVESSCPCLRAHALPWALAPGDEKTVELTLDLVREPEFVGRLLIEITGTTPEHGTAFRAHVDVLVVSGPAKRGISP